MIHGLLEASFFRFRINSFPLPGFSAPSIALGLFVESHFIDISEITIS